MANIFTSRCIENVPALKEHYDKQEQLLDTYVCQYKDDKCKMKKLIKKYKLFQQAMVYGHPKMFSVIGIQKRINSGYTDFVQHMFKGLGIFAERNNIAYVCITQPLKIMQNKVKDLHSENILKYEDFSIVNKTNVVYPIYTEKNLKGLDNGGLTLLNGTNIVDKTLAKADDSYKEVYDDLVETRNLFNSTDIFADIINNT